MHSCRLSVHRYPRLKLSLPQFYTQPRKGVAHSGSLQEVLSALLGICDHCGPRRADAVPG